MTMDFIIKSKDEVTGLTGENRYPTEEGFAWRSKSSSLTLRSSSSSPPYRTDQ
jgi:hypothetical protein